MTPTAYTTADQCRQMGLLIGDIIEGTEGEGTEWENTVRLTLLWLGDDIAVWRETCFRRKTGKWTAQKESADWKLSCRDWKRITSTKEAP